LSQLEGSQITITPEGAISIGGLQDFQLDRFLQKIFQVEGPLFTVQFRRAFIRQQTGVQA
jgi:hypothetical protein